MPTSRPYRGDVKAEIISVCSSPFEKISLCCPRNASLFTNRDALCWFDPVLRFECWSKACANLHKAEERPLRDDEVEFSKGSTAPTGRLYLVTTAEQMSSDVLFSPSPQKRSRA